MGRHTKSKNKKSEYDAPYDEYASVDQPSGYGEEHNDAPDGFNTYSTYAEDADVTQMTPPFNSGATEFQAGSEAYENPIAEYPDAEYSEDLTSTMSALDVDDVIDDQFHADVDAPAEEDEVGGTTPTSTSKGKGRADFEELEDGYDLSNEEFAVQELSVEEPEPATYSRTKKGVSWAEMNEYDDATSENPQYGDPEEAGEEDIAPASELYDYSTEQVGEPSAASASYYDYQVQPYEPQAQEFDPLVNAPKGPRLSGPGQPRPVNPNYQYQLCHSAYFSPGAVFKTIWPEPKGAASVKHFTGTILEAKSGSKNVHVTTRRFIVVSTVDNQSYCVPIFTYGSQGCKKHGVKAQRHGMVYSSDVPPELLEDEPELGFGPVQMIPSFSHEYLYPESRVNYSNVCTIQHNIRAHFIGYIDPEDMEHIVLRAVYDIFNEAKDRRKKK